MSGGNGSWPVWVVRGWRAASRRCRAAGRRVQAWAARECPDWITRWLLPLLVTLALWSVCVLLGWRDSWLIWYCLLMVVAGQRRKQAPSRTVETLARASAPQETKARKRLVIRTSREWWAVWGTLCLSFAAVSLMWVERGMEGLYVVAGFLSVLSIPCWTAYLAGATIEANDEGISVGSAGKRIGWDEIGSCTITTQRNQYGGASEMACDLLDEAGQRLLRVDLAPMTAKDRQQFLELLKAKRGLVVPRELIAAEAPAGLGTELQSAQAPAGRGTELEGIEPPVVPEPEAGPARSPAAGRKET